MSDELIALVTASSHSEATRIADALVSDRLAACVNIIEEIDSVYRWEGKVTHGREALMIIKTTAARYDELQRRVMELHSYTTPEIIALKIEQGSGEYLSWVRDSTSEPELE